MFSYHRGLILAKAGDVGESRKALYHALSQNPYFDPIGALAAMKMVHEIGSVAVAGK